MVATLNTSLEGLCEKEALRRLHMLGQNSFSHRKQYSLLTLFFNQIKTPLMFLLLACALLAFFLSDPTDAVIILIILLISVFLGVFQEKTALNALDKLLKHIQIKCKVIREGSLQEIPSEHLVPGDIVILHAGDAIPADCYILEVNHCFVNESSLTGESESVEKFPGTIANTTPLAQRSNVLFMGTHIISGLAKALVIYTGKNTEFGKIAEHLNTKPLPTAFEISLKKFGTFLVRMTFILVILIFAINIFLHHPVLESFLFALALGIGFTPQLLPAIVTTNLTYGAKYLAKKKVIVKKLSAIENFGSMNILCCDKTGTLTTGSVELIAYCDGDGRTNPKTLLYGAINAILQAGFTNPLDLALSRAIQVPPQWKKLDEIPFDFSRKRISLLATDGTHEILITKGVFGHILPLCKFLETSDGKIVPIDNHQENLENFLIQSSQQGIRLLAVAYRPLPQQHSFTETNETDLIFLGYLAFVDPLKPNVIHELEELQHCGISLKIISGDHPLVVEHLAQALHLKNPKALTGAELSLMPEELLMTEVLQREVFAEVEPLQKEKILKALQKQGYTVGFLGDGINDTTALHCADVSISVNNATNVAKSTADFILLEHNLHVLKEGVLAGRRTFANTLKYIFMATSANFGNMLSMALSSLFLTFLPLLPKQVLLTNLLTDIPELAISTDHVDAQVLKKPRKWDIPFLKRFMLTFGLISSFYDLLTFALLLWKTRSITEFRTGWFLESVLSAITILIVIRTHLPIFKSRPSSALLTAIIGVFILTLLLPYTPMASILGFCPLPLSILALIAAIILLYAITAEVVKRFFYNSHPRKIPG